MKKEELLAKYSGVQIPWGPIGEQVYRRTYSQVKPDGRKETWQETVTRAVLGNLRLAARSKNAKIDPNRDVIDQLVEQGLVKADEAEKLAELLMLFDGLPAGRHLNASGVPGREFLFNCLSGDTLVQTRNGLFPIRELASFHNIEVLSMVERTQSGVGCWKTPSVGVWRKASFQSFGTQNLFEVVFSDGSKVRATGDHKWYVTKRAEPVMTTNLVGHDVPFVAPPKPERDSFYEKGLLHGFVYGDGSVSVNGGKVYSANVQMFAEKDLDLIPIFQKHGYEVTFPDYCKAYVGRLPAEWKDLPPGGSNEDDRGASPSYWLGFINGLIAADGTVDKTGSVYIYQADKKALEIISRKAQEVGFVTSPLYLQRENNPWTGEPAACWRLNLRRFSIAEEDLVLNHHRSNFIEAGESKVSSMKVIAVNDLNIQEEVYCAIEPETHTFVIGNNILTGNCHAAGWDYAEPQAHFTFTFDSLMQGGGVGSNYSNRYIDQLPKVETSIDLHIICRDDHPDLEEFYQLLTEVVPADEASHRDVYHVADSREGWVDSISFIMEAAFGHHLGGGREAKLVIDVSPIRARGSILKTSGGIACGPGPLVSMLSDFVKHLNSCFDRKFTSLDAMILDHTMAACVVAGGKRRSSRMSVKNWKDRDILEFINCKREDGSHWTTNISVETDDEFEAAYNDPAHAFHRQARDVARAVVLGCRSNGEPGFWNRALSMKGERDPELMFCPNPCGEIGLQMWENCNLGHINLQAFANRRPQLMHEAFRLMTRWLMRATFGDIPNPRQREVVDRNRRIGVGFFGYHGFTSLRGIKYSESWSSMEVIRAFQRAKLHIDDEATSYADILGIPVPVKRTTVAPTGSVAALPGTSTGDQSIYAPVFKRLVRYSDMDPELAIKKLEGYITYVDPDARNTSIVEYWCEDPLVAKVRSTGIDVNIIEAQDEISFEDSLRVQAMIQTHWADNAVSHTINLPYDRMGSEEEMETTLMKYHQQLKGTTIFPDKSRRNAPLQRLTREQFDAYQGRKEVTMTEVECVGGCPVK